MDIRSYKTADIDSLIKAGREADKSTEKKGPDPRMWKPSVDESGNGWAQIRFLPGDDDSSLPWAKWWDHGFKGATGKWYIEKSLTSIGEKDPLGEYNSSLWATSDDKNCPMKAIARKQKRRLHYVSNIMVVNDSLHPENNGKVFLYVYGKKIFDKLMDAMQPEYPDEKPINPFHPIEGADFLIKIATIKSGDDSFRNYDKSNFKAPSPMFPPEDEQAYDEVLGQLHSFAEWVNPEHYKSYDQLKSRLAEVLGENVVLGGGLKVNPPQDPPVIDSMPEPEINVAPALQEAETTVVSESTEEDDDDVWKYFNKLSES